MRFGYTIADSASESVFETTVLFIRDRLGYQPDSKAFVDVDGSIRQTFQKGSNHLTVESDEQIDYVGIVSDVDLGIDGLIDWHAD